MASKEHPVSRETAPSDPKAPRPTPAPQPKPPVSFNDWADI
ncbi:hypothetical protein [Celeribacter sp.]